MRYLLYPSPFAAWLMLLMVGFGGQAYADNRMANDARFFPLDNVRNSAPPARSITQRPAPQAIRSDRKALERGFFRMDRTSVMRRDLPARVVRATAPASDVAAAQQDIPRITRGSAVLDVFGDSGAEDPVFGETLRGAAASAPGRHIWPIATNVKQELSSGYGMRNDPFHGRPAFHGGIDIAAASGTPVLASAAGIVTKTGTGRGYGNYVLLAHADGTETRYSHLSADDVHEGQRVAQGQKIGRVGSTGRSTGPHLDYRIRKNGQRFDPLTVVRAPTSVTSTKVAQVIRVR
jgi:murein DD-endopeptidase MepM/ murein hydrolase activator NlpD